MKTTERISTASPTNTVSLGKASRACSTEIERVAAAREASLKKLSPKKGRRR